MIAATFSSFTGSSFNFYSMEIITHATKAMPPNMHGSGIGCKHAFSLITSAVLIAAVHTATAAPSGWAKRYMALKQPRSTQVTVGKGRLALRGLGIKRATRKYSRPNPPGAN